MDKYNFFKKDASRPDAGLLSDTKLFYRNAAEICARFDKWKGVDSLYFIPLYMEMTYTVGGIVAEMAPDPVWLGSFVRCTLNHPELFQFRCPECGRAVLPYRCCGSPLSGRVDLEGRCSCGWSGFESVSGWRQRAVALRDQLSADKARHRWYRILHPSSAPATVEQLLDSFKED